MFYGTTTSDNRVALFDESFICSPVDANNQPHVLDLIGHNLGLGVVINENGEDFKYIRRNSIGAEVYRIKL